MRTFRLTMLLTLIVGILIGINCCVEPRSKQAVRIVAPPTIIASLPHWVAEERGFYEEEGLEISAVNLTASDLMVQALISGDADILPAVSLVNVVNSGSKAIMKPLVFSHSRMYKGRPFESILVLRASQMATLKDLAGKKIGVYPGITSMAAVHRFLIENGVDTSNIEFVPLSPPEHILALQRGDIAASHIYEPFRTQNLRSGHTRELFGSVYAFLQDGCAIGVSAMSSRFLSQNRKASERFLRAWDRSIDFIEENQEEARAILARHLNLTEEVASEATWVNATKSSEIDRSAVIQTAKLFQEIGAIDGTVVLDESLFLPYGN